MHTWQLQEAKAKFSELVEKCQKEAQLVTRHGKAMAYVVSASQFDKLIGAEKKRKKMTLGDFLRSSPLFASGIELDLHSSRVAGAHREVVFDDTENEGRHDT